MGCGMTAVGIALVIPACTSWSLGLVDSALRKSRASAESAAELLGGMAGKAHHRFGEAAKGATAKAAEVVESAARQVREYAS